MIPRLLAGAVRHLLLVLLGGTALAWAAQVAADVRLSAPAPTAFVLARDGSFLTQAGHESLRPGGGRQVEYGFWPAAAVPGAEPPPLAVAATLALEDRRFRFHPGVDAAAAARAAWHRLSGGPRSGASTLAMQVVRMQHPRPRTPWAKAVEAGAAVGITLRFGRDAVLAQYLRLAPYGENSRGIAHAARWYFDRPLADLGAAEAALLAALPQAPGRLSLRPHGLERARARARRALLAVPLPPAERAAALERLARAAPVPAPRQPPDLLAALNWRRRASGLAAQGAGGVVRASLAPPVQAMAAERARTHLARWARAGAQRAAVMVVRRADGAVLAAVGGAGMPGTSGGPGAPGDAIDFTRASRSPGSALKPFLYAMGLERDLIAPDQVLADVPELGGGINNADHDYLGPVLPRQALANSRNVPAAALLRRIGLVAAFENLRSLRLHDEDGPASRFGLALSIGALPTSLERLMRAYRALADGGVDREPRWFAAAPEPAPRRVIAVDAARLVGRFLSDPMARMPSFPRYGSTEFPFAAALKTGTSQGYRDAWTLAWSHEYLVGAWMGRPDAGPMDGVSGARGAAALVQDVLLRLHGSGRTDLLAGEFATPAGRREAELCAETGRPAEAGCARQLSEWVRAPIDPPIPDEPPPTRLTIVRPDTATHLWRNPDLPPALNRLVLRAAVEPPAPQLVWLVNGQPVSVGASDAPLVWTMVPGRFRFQVRLPAQDAVSAPVLVVVE